MRGSLVLAIIGLLVIILGILVNYSDARSYSPSGIGLSILGLGMIMTVLGIIISLIQIDRQINSGRQESFPTYQKTLDDKGPAYDKPSMAWYLLPIFLGIVGGLIGYFVLRDRHKPTARNCIVIGLILTAVGILIGATGTMPVGYI